MADSEPIIPNHPADDVVDWRYVANVLADELRRWGWGDFHYGPQAQEKSVCDALAVYEDAMRRHSDGEVAR